jgi:uncharacterized protein YbjQ (UPF0145 family)
MSDLSPRAAERLNVKTASGARFFTSDLSVNEFAVVKEAGFDPLGLVMGSCIYHIGYQAVKFSQSQEMAVLTQAMYHARELAMARLEAEAEVLKADGVVGVRLEIRMLDWGEEPSSLAEFKAVGTAVVSRDKPGSFRTAQNKPFTSHLSGQDFWTLLRSGYRPLGFVMGNCVYHVAHQSFGQMMKTMGQNTEIAIFTQALYDARELAMERLQAEAQKLNAEGVVGVSVDEGGYWIGHIIEFSALGTAVIPTGAPPAALPQIVLSMND